MDLRVIQAHVEDAERLAGFGKKVLLESFGDRYSKADLEQHLRDNYTSECYTRWLSQPETCLFYAEGADGLEGYVLGWPCSLPVNTEGRRAFELRRLYVRKDAKGAGIAQKLLLACINWAKEHRYERLYIGIWEGNYRDRAYTRYGFTPVGSHSFHVGGQTDTDLILMKEL